MPYHLAIAHCRIDNVYYSPTARIRQVVFLQFVHIYFIFLPWAPAVLVRRRTKFILTQKCHAEDFSASAWHFLIRLFSSVSLLYVSAMPSEPLMYPFMLKAEEWEFPSESGIYTFCPSSASSIPLSLLPSASDHPPASWLRQP